MTIRREVEGRRLARELLVGLGLLVLLPSVALAQPSPAEPPAGAAQAAEPAPAPAPATATAAEPAPAEPTAIPSAPTAESPPLPVERPALSVRRLIAEGKLREALKILDEIQATSPGDDEVRLQRTRVLYWLQRLTEAEAEARALLDRHPTDLEAMELLAQILLAKGDLRGSLQTYQAIERAGVNRPDLHQRIIDLHLQLGDTAGARQALAAGGSLTDEQELALSKVERPWIGDVASFVTLFNTGPALRLDAAVGRRLSRTTLLAGAILEQRGKGADVQRSWSPKAELYTGTGPLELMLHLSGSPDLTFLPALDARLDGTVQLTPNLAAGLYLRWARYPPDDTFAFAPNLPITWKTLTITPGWMGVASPKGFSNTGFLKLRLQQTARTSFLLWTFVGPDPSLIERFGFAQSIGGSVLGGIDHWFRGGRWGLRATLTQAIPGVGGDGYTELGLALRGRL